MLNLFKDLLMTDGFFAASTPWTLHITFALLSLRLVYRAAVYMNSEYSVADRRGVELHDSLIARGGIVDSFAANADYKRVCASLPLFITHLLMMS